MSNKIALKRNKIKKRIRKVVFGLMKDLDYLFIEVTRKFMLKL